ncbi:sensor domain-containing protein [Microbispora sp. RL4-1S]|uniref:histidine kinase n=1 Tax=Microbispora oryzae TaxID=2806554 RepID=A0A940WJV2_9ACTN|nr:sensor histidine kinase [Microbispora oryzae]MBP2706298.1 sensor domain-containing protein [Microbispora oryzae]
MTPSPWERIRAGYSGREWLRTVHIAVGLPTGLLAATVIIGLAILSVVFVWTVIAPVVGLPLLLWAVPFFTRVQRARFSAYLGVDIPPIPPPGPGVGPLRRLIQRARRRSTWRQVAYHLLAPLISAAGAIGLAATWSGGVAGVILALRALFAGDTWWWAPPAIFALAGFLLGPWVARVISTLDTLAAEALLGPSLSDELAQRVETLQVSRTELIEAADAERRRIERDLHDGAQQRLVSLAMDLGMARAVLTDLPEPAREVIARAHEESKLVLKELREFVRGLHPAVLNDQGLDAALSGIASRVRVPVRLCVELDARPSPAIEAVAFFVVSEALANVAKHARASAAEVTVRTEEGRLRLSVRDDGRGGADPHGGGTGLRGLAQRVGSVDGTLTIESPRGGPTTIEADLPCV